MRVLIFGAGRMGSWLINSFCLKHDISAYDIDNDKLKKFSHIIKINTISEVKKIKPEMVINAVPLPLTQKAFDTIIPYLSQDCILSDLMSIKGNIHNYYKKNKRRFVSSHPMFGPTFANMNDLQNENAIVIKEGDKEGKKIFKDFYNSLKLNVHEYTFKMHDKTMSYSLSLPFILSLIFASFIRKQNIPGTTYKKHFGIVKGLLGEDDLLLSEIIFNPYSIKLLEKANVKLSYIMDTIKRKNYKELFIFLHRLRNTVP